MAATRGVELGGGAADTAATRAEGREALRRAILEVTAVHPSWSPSQVGESLETSHTTVIRVQREAGVYRSFRRVVGGLHERRWTRDELEATP